MPRIDPLEPPYDAETDEQLRAMMPPGMSPIALFRAFAKNMPMTRAMRGWGSYELSKELSLGLREREIVIDRTCARCGCEYEWGVHAAVFAGAVQLSEAEIAATAARGVAPLWSEREAVLVELVDELHDGGRVSAALWARLAEHYDERQRLELLVLCGWYHLISFVANGAGVALESWARRFPAT